MSDDPYHQGNRDGLIWLFQLVESQDERSALLLVANYLKKNYPNAPIKEALSYIDLYT